MQDTPKGSRIQKGSKIHQKKEARYIKRRRNIQKGSHIQKGSKIHHKKEARHTSLNMHQILVEIGGNTKKSKLEEHT